MDYPNIIIGGVGGSGTRLIAMLLASLGLNIGNDINDLGAMRKAKFSICPSDAVKAVKKEVDLKLKTKGGYGVLSELVTLIES